MRPHALPEYLTSGRLRQGEQDAIEPSGSQIDSIQSIEVWVAEPMGQGVLAKRQAYGSGFRGIRGALEMLG
jgi:hypothetical protein